FEAGIISGPPQVLRYGAGETWHREQQEAQMENQQTPRIRAWVLIKVPAKHIGDLVEELRAYPGIVEASAIYGETDVIAKIEVASHPELDDLIVNRIQSIENVVSTRTFIGIGGLHWQREA
ncbi:MAG TPA: Lrp/AsnC ligand binding domain-containing protein, partial [Chloroflexota bacterium]|nr:Lrp/AsnC ligand binding domain-containing protein [Chloroflexota bacterium]